LTVTKAARAKISDAYDKTEQAMATTVKYGMHHPGQASLVAFGVGLGMGMWLSASRKRPAGLGPALADALGSLGRQLLGR
jgi:hypothetical protein